MLPPDKHRTRLRDFGWLPPQLDMLEVLIHLTAQPVKLAFVVNMLMQRRQPATRIKGNKWLIINLVRSERTAS